MLTVEIREDSIGPGEQGFRMDTDCGCIMTHICRAVGLSDAAQEQDRDELARRLGWTGHRQRFGDLVNRVQNNQDAAFHNLALGQIEAARKMMRTAMALALEMGVQVKWLPGTQAKLEAWGKKFKDYAANKRLFM